MISKTKNTSIKKKWAKPHLTILVINITKGAVEGDFADGAAGFES